MNEETIMFSGFYGAPVQAVIDFESEKKLNGAGYEELGTGLFVPAEDAYKFALERISMSEEEQREFVEWFYSGNFVWRD